MDRRLKWATFGVASCVAASLLATLLTSRPDQPVGAQITVPQAEVVDLDIPKPPPAYVSVLLPSPPIATQAPPTSERRQPLVPQPKPPAPTTSPKPAAMDFQAEDARIHNGWIASNHTGFTGSGFVDYNTAAGGAVEWAVPATAAGGADVVFRFANGSSQARPMAVTVNGTPAGYFAFPATNGWSDWQVLTVHTNLSAGTNTIRATAMTGNGGPNVDKITLLPAT